MRVWDSVVYQEKPHTIISIIEDGSLLLTDGWVTSLWEGESTWAASPQECRYPIGLEGLVFSLSMLTLNKSFQHSSWFFAGRQPVMQWKPTFLGAVLEDDPMLDYIETLELPRYRPSNER
jgi:hypothetical protein